VDYDQSLDGVLSGRDTATLVVQGLTVTVDARALSEQTLGLDGISTTFSNTTPFTYVVLPGSYFLRQIEGASVDFQVNADGTVDYDPTLDSVLSGRGTATLVVKGVTVTVDARALSDQILELGYSEASFSDATPFNIVVVPGFQVLGESGGGQVDFHVNADGTVDYDPTLDSVLSGRDTATLTVHGVMVTIDARTLSLPTFSLDFLPASYSTTTPFNSVVLPGGHELVQNGSSVAFQVNPDGTVAYDPTLNNVLSGRGTTTLTVNGATVTIDPRRLTTLNFLYVDNTVASQTNAPFTFTGLPGPHFLEDNGGSGASLAFTIAADGTVGYDPGLEGVLTGHGTSTLTVNGVTITIDARQLSLAYVNVDDNLFARNNAPITFTGLPGPASLIDSAGAGASVSFILKADGTVDYDPSLNRILSGRGTSTLAVNGVTVTIDATQLSLDQLTVDNAFTTATPVGFTFTGLPGPVLLTDLGSGFTAGFTLNADGTVDYAAAVAGVLSGSGTTTLLVHDVTVTIDARSLSLQSLVLYNNLNLPATESTGGPVTNTAFAFKALPGTYTLQDIFGSAAVQFSVGADGNVSYSSSLQGILTGAGTSTLTVHGATVTIDATALTQDYLFIDVFYQLQFQTTAAVPVALLPGPYSLLENVGGSVSFQVNTDGSLNFSSSLDSVLSGRGTSTLIVHGVPVAVDATALTPNVLSSDGGQYAVNFSTTAEFHLVVLPGSNLLSLLGGASAGVTYQVSPDGTLNFASSLNQVLSVSSDGTLIVHGVPVTIDATALSKTGLGINAFLTDYSSTTPFQVVVLPGTQILRSDEGGGYIFFQANADGTIDYDASLNNVLSGRGLTTLTVHGVTVNIDATALTPTTLYVNDPQTSYNSAMAFQVVVLPGGAVLRAVNGTDIFLTVNADGTIDYDASLNNVLSVSSDGTLIVHGETLKVDATALSPQTPTFTLQGWGNFSTAQVQTFTIFPGNFQVDVGALVVNATLSVQDLLAFDTSLDNRVQGRGTNTLVLLPPS